MSLFRFIVLDYVYTNFRLGFFMKRVVYCFQQFYHRDINQQSFHY